jgi:hypothetical protein
LSERTKPRHTRTAASELARAIAMGQKGDGRTKVKTLWLTLVLAVPLLAREPVGRQNPISLQNQPLARTCFPPTESCKLGP